LLRARTARENGLALAYRAAIVALDRIHANEGARELALRRFEIQTHSLEKEGLKMNKSGTFRQLESNLRRTLFLCVAVLFLAAPARAQEVNGGAPQMPEETPLTTSKPAAFSGFGTGTVTVTSGHCAGLTGTNCWSFSRRSRALE
jgi:hypothetical protein